MNKISFLLLAASMFLPIVAQADAVPPELNLCTSMASEIDGSIQKLITPVCSSSSAMKQLVLKYQQDNQSASSWGAMGGLGNWFSGNKSAAPAPAPTAPGNSSTGIAPNIYK